MPALPDNVRLVVAGREPPMAGWPMALGRRFRSLPLGNLPRAEAEVLLRRDGVTGDDIERINWLARGHPLSLRMAAAALRRPPPCDHDATTVTAIVDELTELYLGRARSGDPRGPRRGVGRPPAHDLAARGDAP